MSRRVRAAPGAKKVKSVVCGGVYVAKYTLRAARKNARFGANPLCQKRPSAFVDKVTIDAP